MRYETKNEIVTTSLLFRVASTGKYDGMAGISRSAQRIAELETVEENIAQLLHFAGCTLASLHPDPLAQFTSKTTAFADDEDEDDPDDSEPRKAAPASTEEGKRPSDEEPPEKLDQFKKYSEAYYVTLNEIQLSLRNSIRHLRVTKASPAPLLDPRFGALSNPAGGIIAAGGVAFADRLKPLPSRTAAAEGMDATDERKEGTTMSVAALRLEKEAWEDLALALKPPTEVQVGKSEDEEMSG